MNKSNSWWKNLWTILRTTMWEKCGNLLWKTRMATKCCVKAEFFTKKTCKSGKVLHLIYTGLNRGKIHFYTVST